MKPAYSVLVVFIVCIAFLTYYTGQGLLPNSRSCPVCNEAKSTCLWNEFSDVVLVIVYNYPLYSSIPDLTALYKNAFPTIMFCGSGKAKNHTVEALPIHKGYFAYTCMSRAMEKYPGYSGYLLTNDDAILNYWNLVGLKRDRIWEGPKAAIRFKNYSMPSKHWYWWDTLWGVKSCQKAYNELWALQESNPDKWFLEIDNHKEERTDPQTIVWNKLCPHGRSDVFYIPGRFANAFITLSNVFYKHKSFLEIAIPTICRMLDVEENFEYISGVYLPGYPGDALVRKAQYFWEVYNKTLVFVHPFKLNYKGDGAINSILLRSRIIEYSDSLSKCKRS